MVGAVVLTVLVAAIVVTAAGVAGYPVAPLSRASRNILQGLAR